MKPASYRSWATDIVRWAVKPSLRPASCCIVVVRNGAYGRRVYGLDSMLSTANAGAAQRLRQRLGLRLVQRDQLLVGPC